MTILPLLSLLALSFAAAAYPEGPCADPVVVGSATTVQVGDAQVLMSSFSCPSESEPKKRGTLTARAPRDVCGEPCTIVSCLDIGTSPSGSDCAIIADAMDILAADLGSTYALNASNGYYKQLVFGTCLTYIGVSAEEDTTACWSDWSSIIGQLLNACPESPIGACTSFPPDITWADFSMEIRHS
ncbi:hypothetical protein MSAN_00694700 [Mycena sanguinolenta]|uniref:Uncharacterized protein n=1 Tax=Mycena sanguinolenta TaxID=230812 RepID=A0A8H7DF08_9AGAR|nr:hypothetical protein MSAN_00694700 [Mycena sanguinolenta]